MTTICLSDLYDELVELDAAADLAEAELREAERALRATPEGRACQEAQDRLEKAKLARRAADEALRNAALNEYTLSGETRPHERVSIRVRNVTSYDEGAAVLWAYENKPEWVRPARIKKREFEKAARALAEAGLPLEFVRFEEVPSVAVSLNGA